MTPKERPHDRRQSSGSISIHVKRRVASFFLPLVSWSVPLLVVAAAAEDEVANQGGIKDLSLFMLFLFLLLFHCIASSLRVKESKSTSNVIGSSPAEVPFHSASSSMN